MGDDAVTSSYPRIDSDSTCETQKSSDICGGCWKGVIANQLGLLQVPVKSDEQLSATDWEPPTGGYVYKVSQEEIEHNAKQGCRWCDLVCRWGSSSMRNPSVTKSENIVETRVGYSDHAKTCLQVTVNERICWYGYVYTTEDDPAAAYVSGRSLSCDVASERALELSKGLLLDCTLNHTECPSPSEPYSTLPTRVIDCSDPAKPRLWATNGTRARYIALSYVWGTKPQVHKTTIENLDSHMRSLNINVLPQTIVDGIQVTHRLGIQYLWIDSLCIIQDSKEDMVYELARMRSVYADAYLTIIAASASQVSEGFLKPRTDTLGKAAIRLPFVLPATDATSSGGESGSIFLSSWMITGPKYDPGREPAHTRGWCMQEYFLSPRKLVFASHTLQYSCFSGGTRNIGGADNPWWISSERDPVPYRKLPILAPSLSLSHTFDLSRTEREPVETVRKAWKATIENYTKREVFVPSDKLVAVSALAEEFSHTIQSRYLAGLWARTLIPDLLWSKERAAHFASRPKTYRAPSWSWASLDGSINSGNAYFLSEREEVVAEVVACETVLKHPELPFGEVTGGTLVLRARVANDCVVLPHWAVYRFREHRDGDELLVFEAQRRAANREPLIDDATRRRMDEIGMCRLDSDDDGIRSGVKRVSVVPLYARWESDSDVHRVVQGLVLERLDATSEQLDVRGRYRRIGFFEGSEHIDEWLNGTPEIEVEIV